MKRLLLFLFAIVAFAAVNAQVNSQSHWVDGYYKSDGTYVPGHYRTNPNNTVRDNYSTYPNINPHTGEQGTKHVSDQSNGTYWTDPRGTQMYVPSYDEPKQPRRQQQTDRAPIYWIDAAGNVNYVP